jgi:signal peptidase I
LTFPASPFVVYDKGELFMDENITNQPVVEQGGAPIEPTEKRHSFGREIWETIRFIIIALLIVLPIRLFIAQPFIVSGASMDPTFENGQYLIVDEISYRVSEPARGDVVIFKYPKNPKQYFIKRVIGLPGETVTTNAEGHIVIKNTEQGMELALEEPYISNPIKSGPFNRTLGADEYFMMGDNRTGSFDSRMWGPVKRDLIIGRALVRLFPFTTISLLPGEHTYK